ncbi:hypothetical protein Gpo141_00003106 [Globisporangium polare]
MPGQVATALTIGAMLAVAQVAAMPTYPAKIPNGSNVKGVAALGHVDPSGGGDRNAFGKAFQSAGHVWTTELCKADSDGDGQTNGEELGDPCCKWVVGSNEKVQWATGVSNPGNATSTSDASLWANVTCGTTSAVATGSSNSTSSSPTSTTTAPTATTPTATTPTATTPAPTKSGAAAVGSFAVASVAAMSALAAIFA